MVKWRCPGEAARTLDITASKILYYRHLRSSGVLLEAVPTGSQALAGQNRPLFKEFRGCGGCYTGLFFHDRDCKT
jgi:hypothetical protein